MNTKPLACRHHNHDLCIEEAISAARKLCLQNGARLTQLREQVLELIWQSHKPLGAYALMDMLAEASTRRVAPPTVYRALDFLLEQHLIHRINSLNAYIGCPEPHKQHQNHFLICRECGIATECDNLGLSQQINAAGQGAGFAVESQCLEIVGLCPNCQSPAEQEAGHYRAPQT